MSILTTIKRVMLKGCIFCSKGGNIKKEKAQCMYGRAYYFHDKCLTSVLTTPETYTNSQVDMALDLEEIIKDRKKREKYSRDTRMKRIIKAQNRMEET